MPELPEAETIARGLNGFLPGQAIGAVTVLRQDVVAGPAADLAAALTGRRFGQVARRGKNVVMSLAPPPHAPERRDRVVANLGMSGRFISSSEPGPAPSSTHPAVVFDLVGGPSLTYDDVRRFGLISFMATAAWRRWSSRLGPEPLARSFTGARLRATLGRSRSPVRSLLLDQRRVAGVGNIYAVEALWLARLHPQTPSREVDPATAARLHRSLRRVLRRAILAGGTTLRNYRALDGAEGRFRQTLHAYGREGLPCPRCGAAILRIVFGGRSAFLCPECQPPRGDAAPDLSSPDGDRPAGAP